MEKIVCAAIHFKDDKKHPHQPVNINLGLVICGLRHHNCIAIKAASFMRIKMDSVQGFLTTHDRFVDRYEGYKIAERENQIKGKPHDFAKQQLFSEDLY